jgi:hypothetical protein
MCDTGTGPTFVWRHGNVRDAVRDDGCAHSKVGPHGHRGIIEVRIADDEGFRCTAW